MELVVDLDHVAWLLSCRVDRSAGPNACWPWKGTPTRQGYGRFSAAVAHGLILRMLAHRVAWLVTHGSVDDVPELDHTCHNADASCNEGVKCRHRLCCNPRHLESVTRKEHAQRGRSNAAKDACRKGHPFDGVNNRGQRTCSICTKERARRNHAKRRAAQGLPVYTKPGAPSPRNVVDPSTIR